VGRGHLTDRVLSADGSGSSLTPDSIVRLEDGRLVLLDQTRLPSERVERSYGDWHEIVEAIRSMVVRGAPAIGIAAAYGAAVAARGGREEFERACDGLAAARPTAVNLRWAIERMRASAEEAANGDQLVARLDQCARELHRQEVARCHAIGEHGAALLDAGARVLTHCNAGALATGGYGTALGVIRSAHRRDPSLTVWVDETRPLLQGARLTAWELEQDGIPATLLTDSMAGWLMAERRIDAVVVAMLPTRSAPTRSRCWPAPMTCRSSLPRPRPRSTPSCPTAAASPSSTERPRRFRRAAPRPAWLSTIRRST
jgi:methylthioribose-1-phosphate isomerase